MSQFSAKDSPFSTRACTSSIGAPCFSRPRAWNRYPCGSWGEIFTTSRISSMAAASSPSWNRTLPRLNRALKWPGYAVTSAVYAAFASSRRPCSS